MKDDCLGFGKMTDDNLLLVGISILGFGYLAYYMMDNSEQSATQLYEMKQLEAIKQKYIESCAYLDHGTRLLDDVQKGIDPNIDAMQNLLTVIPLDMRYFSDVMKEFPDFDITKQLREEELTKDLRTLYEALMAVRDAGKTQTVVRGPKMAITSEANPFQSVPSSPSLTHAWSTNADLQDLRDQDRNRISKLDGLERLTAEREFAAAQQRHASNVDLTRSDGEASFQQGRTISAAIQSRQENSTLDIVMARMDRIQEKMERTDEIGEIKSPPSAQTAAKEALAKIGLNSGRKLSLAAQKVQINPQMLQSARKRISDQDDRLQNAIRTGIPRPKARLSDSGFESEPDDEDPIELRKREDLFADIPTDAPPPKRPRSPRQSMDFTDLSAEVVLSPASQGKPPRLSRQFVDISEEVVLSPPKRFEPNVGQYNQMQNSKRLIDGIATIKWPGALPKVPVLLGGLTAGGGIMERVPSTELLKDIYTQYRELSGEGRIGTKRSAFRKWQSEFKFYSVKGNEIKTYSDFWKFAQLRRYYRKGKKYKGKMVAPQRDFGSDPKMKVTFEFFMDVEEYFANLVGVELPIDHKPQDIPNPYKADEDILL